MITVISCLLGAELLFHQMTMETALKEPAVKSWRRERALPYTPVRCILPSFSGLRYLCPSLKPQKRLQRDRTNLRQYRFTKQHQAQPGEQGRADGLLSPQQLQPQPSCRASFGCLSCVSGVLGGEVGCLSSSLFFSLQSLMLYMGGKALFAFRAASLRCI